MVVNEPEAAMGSRYNVGNLEKMSREQAIALFVGGEGQNQTGMLKDIYTTRWYTFNSPIASHYPQDKTQEQCLFLT